MESGWGSEGCGCKFQSWHLEATFDYMGCHKKYIKNNKNILSQERDVLMR